MLEPRIAAAYDAWRAQPGLPEDLAAELASSRGTRKRSPTGFTASWPLAPAACGASSGRAPTG